jgi:hypothetical protein
MENYSVVKKNKIMSFVEKSIKLEIIVSDKIRQTKKDKYHIFSLICKI